MERFVIGIDGGGAHTAVCLMNVRTGDMVCTEVGASNIHAIGLDAACEAIQQATRSALAEAVKKYDLLEIPLVEAMTCCLSGAGRETEQQAIRENLTARGLAEKIDVHNDAEALLASARIFDAGIAVIAGTGSFVWGRNGSGQIARADGWGSLLGDSSGGFGIGLAGLRAVCRCHDGSGPETRLLDLALEHYGLKSATELIERVAVPTIPRDSVAQFAPRVFAAAEAMDAVGMRIVEEAVADLAASTQAVRRQLFTADEAVSFVMGGGLALNQVYYRERYANAIRSVHGQDCVYVFNDAPEVGAARLALKMLGIDPDNTAASGESLVNLMTNPPDADSLKQGRRIYDLCATLPTEQRNPKAIALDASGSIDILTLMNEEDRGVAPAVEKVLPEIAEAVERIVEVFRGGGRLFYIGAGTSGRLGCLDAAECPPTFGTPPEMVQAVIAGGAATLLRSREGAEDRAEEAIADLTARGFGAQDILVGLAASRRTPYVLSALEYARGIGAQTVLITCSPQADPLDYVDVMVAPDVGPEVVMGSTRLKAATAQKMILNMLTTASMIRLGKVYRGMMVDLQLSCEKLSERAKRTLAILTEMDYDACTQALGEAGGNVKRAIVMARCACSAADADRALEKSNGLIHEAIVKLTKGR